MKKKANFPVKKRFWPIFSHFIEHNKGQEFLLRVYKVFWHLMCKFQDHFFRTWEVVEITNFWLKRSIFAVKKKLWPVFSRRMECNNSQWTSCKGPRSIVTINVVVMKSTLYDIGGCWIYSFLIKKAIFPDKKNFWPIFFLVLSSVTTLTGYFIIVHKVFWRVLSML